MTVPGGDVHVHYRLVDAVGEDDYQSAWSILSAHERARAARFVFAADRERFVVTHALLRRTLSSHADVAPEAWAFVDNEFGKPALADPFFHAGLSFNLSHTHGLVACAVAQQDVGIDVESIDRTVRALDIASRFFSPVEIAWLRQGSAEEQPVRFLELWTLKEAYVKGVGTGLSHPLDTFGFVFGEAASLRFNAPASSEASHWYFAVFAPSDRHRLALAVRCHPSVVPEVHVRGVQPGPAIGPIFSTRQARRTSRLTL